MSCAQVNDIDMKDGKCWMELKAQHQLEFTGRVS